MRFFRFFFWGFELVPSWCHFSILAISSDRCCGARWLYLAMVSQSAPARGGGGSFTSPGVSLLLPDAGADPLVGMSVALRELAAVRRYVRVYVYDHE